MKSPTHEGDGDAAEAGLGIGQAAADKQAKNAAGGGIAKAAAERRASTDRSCPKDEVGWFADELPGNAADVAGGVLSIGIGSYDTDYSWKAAQDFIHAVAKSGSFAQVYRVPDHLHARDVGGLLENA
jgi:hypothetical protein